MAYLFRNVTIGTDVEFFVKDPDGTVVSAEGLIPGTKTAPNHFVPGDPYFATQLDNVLAEGNIPPATTADEFHLHIMRLRSHMHKIMPAGHRTLAVASAALDAKYLTPNARRFGCDPSLNAWTGHAEPSGDPMPEGETFVRCAGFHVHVGYASPSTASNILLAKVLDMYLGVPAMAIEPPSQRRTLGYGRLGSFRHQKHGCEYRTLSSWFASEPHLVKWVAKQTFEAVNWANRNYGDNVASGDGLRVLEAEVKRIEENPYPKAAALRFAHAWGLNFPVEEMM